MAQIELRCWESTRRFEFVLSQTWMFLRRRHVPIQTVLLWTHASIALNTEMQLTWTSDCAMVVSLQVSNQPIHIGLNRTRTQCAVGSRALAFPQELEAIMLSLLAFMASLLLLLWAKRHHSTSLKPPPSPLNTQGSTTHYQ